MVEFFSQAILKYREFFRRSGSLLLYRGKVFRGQKNENNDTGVLFFAWNHKQTMLISEKQ